MKLIVQTACIAHRLADRIASPHRRRQRAAIGANVRHVLTVRLCTVTAAAARLVV